MSALLRSLATLLAVAALSCASQQKPEKPAVEAGGEPVEMAPSEAPASGGQAPAASGAPAAGGEAAAALTPVAGTEGFTISMPGTPTNQSQNTALPGDAGSARSAYWTSSDPTGARYTVSFVEYPESVVKRATSEMFFNETLQKGLVAQLKNARVVNETPVTLQGYPGRSFTVASDQGEVQGRNFLVGPRIYTLLVQYNPSLGAAQAQAFFDSLQLQGTPANLARDLVAGGRTDGGTMMGADGGTRTDGGSMTGGATMGADAGTRTDGGR
jgi:hypothetical protein